MQIIQSKLLNKFSEITHGFTTKEHKNLAFHVGENRDDVVLHHLSLAKELKYDYQRVVHMRQVHSNIVKILDEKDDYLHPPTCDALITDRKDTPLMVMVADCSPILFYDPKRQVIAVAHAGRAGAFHNIVANVCNSFINDFNSKIDDIVVSVGTSIRECCYEVGEEIYKETQELGLEYAITKHQDTYYLDISKILNFQLLKMGIKNENIDFSHECSACNTNKYFSYRAEKVTGRFCGIIVLK